MSPTCHSTFASSNSSMSGSPIRENAIAPALVVASVRAPEIACVGDCASTGSSATRSPASSPLKPHRDVVGDVGHDTEPGGWTIENKIRTHSKGGAMEAEKAQPEFDLEAATDQSIKACGGDVRAAVRALIVSNNCLIQELEFAWQQVSPGFSRQKRTRRRSTGSD